MADSDSELASFVERIKLKEPLASFMKTVKFLAENPEVSEQRFTPEQAQALLDEFDKMAHSIEGESAAYEAGYEAALEDVNNGTIQMYVVGLLDEVEFMGQEPDRHGITVRGPFFDLDTARAYARTMSTDPDEAVIVPVKI